MTLTSTTVKVQYDGDGSTSSFVVPFVFWDNDDLKVIHTDSSGTETTYTRGTNYTVTGGNGTTGSIAMVTSPNDFTPSSGETLTIKSNLSDLQDLSLPSGGAFPSDDVEQELDQIVRLAQQRSEELGRAVKFREGTEASEVTLPDPSSGASIRWNTDADDLENATATDGGDITLPLPVADGGTGAATAAAARSNLGITTAAAAQTLAKYHFGGL